MGKKFLRLFDRGSLLVMYNALVVFKKKNSPFLDPLFMGEGVVECFFLTSRFDSYLT